MIEHGFWAADPGVSWSSLLIVPLVPVHILLLNRKTTGVGHQRPGGQSAYRLLLFGLPPWPPWRQSLISAKGGSAHRLLSLNCLGTGRISPSFLLPFNLPVPTEHLLPADSTSLAASSQIMTTPAPFYSATAKTQSKLGLFHISTLEQI